MRVAHLTFSTTGGAGAACLRLHAALRRAGVESTVHAAIGPPNLANGVYVRPGWALWRARLDRWRLWRYPRRRFFAWWSDNGFPTRTLGPVLADRPDVLHLHWVGDALLAPAELARSVVPVVWTMHDTWPFTGGCHYPGDCDRFAGGCGACPQLGSTHHRDLSAANLLRKQAAWATARITWVAPSRWLAAEAARSRLLAERRIEVIHYGLDPVAFAPLEQREARREMGITDNDLVLLVGTAGDVSDRRKGVSLFADALRRLAPDVSRRALVLTFGGGDFQENKGAAVRIKSLGRIEDLPRLVQAYSAADAFVLPSLQDNLPNTALEAIACGCPVLAFALGGIGDIVIPNSNGLLALSATGENLADLIAQFAAFTKEGRVAMRAAARRVFLERFRADDRASDYAALYAEKVEGRR
jgi:glycosyltransferase involved in cell wall biosynthesis